LDHLVGQRRQRHEGSLGRSAEGYEGRVVAPGWGSSRSRASIRRLRARTPSHARIARRTSGLSTSAAKTITAPAPRRKSAALCAAPGIPLSLLSAVPAGAVASRNVRSAIDVLLTREARLRLA